MQTGAEKIMAAALLTSAILSTPHPSCAAEGCTGTNRTSKTATTLKPNSRLDRTTIQSDFTKPELDAINEIVTRLNLHAKRFFMTMSVAEKRQAVKLYAPFTGIRQSWNSVTDKERQAQAELLRRFENESLGQDKDLSGRWIRYFGNLHAVGIQEDGKRIGEVLHLELKPGHRFL